MLNLKKIFLKIQSYVKIDVFENWGINGQIGSSQICKMNF